MRSSSEAVLMKNGIVKLFSGDGGRRGALDVNGRNDFLREFGFLNQRLLCGVLALTNQRAFKLQPRAFFFHCAAGDAHVENAAFLVNAVVVDNVKLGLGECGATLFFTILMRVWLP